MTTFDDDARRDSTPSDTMTEDFKSKTREASDAAQRKASEKLDERRDTAADEIENVAHAARAAASDLHEQNHENLSQYVTELANNVSSLASGLRKKSVDELIHDAADIARRNPALFVAGSIAIGLGISRFAKASSHRSDVHQRSEAHQGSGTQYDRNADLDSTKPFVETSLTSGYSSPTQTAPIPSVGNGSSSNPNTIGGTRYE